MVAGKAELASKVGVMTIDGNFSSNGGTVVVADTVGADTIDGGAINDDNDDIVDDGTDDTSTQAVAIYFIPNTSTKFCLIGRKGRVGEILTRK